MARLIDADEAIKKLAYHLGALYAYSDAVEAIANTPTVDAVEVVRCKDCKYWERPEIGTGCCDHMMGDQFGYSDPNDFCSCGVRRKSDG